LNKVLIKNTLSLSTGMDSLLSPIQDALEGQIDFHGQRITEFLCTALIAVSGVVAFIAGYLYQDVYVTLWIGLAGTALTAMVVVPPWPIYNTHPEKWLSVRGGGIRTTGIVVHGLKVD